MPGRFACANIGWFAFCRNKELLSVHKGIGKFFYKDSESQDFALE